MNNENIEIREKDAFEALPELETDSCHAAVVDYPWEQNIKNKHGRMEHRNTTRALDEGARDVNSDDSMFEMESDDRFMSVIDELSRILIEGGYIICFADDRFQDVVRGSLENHSEWIFRRNWAWTTDHIGMGYYGRVNHYPLPVATNGPTDRYVQDRGTLYHAPNARTTEYDTGKDPDLLREVLKPPVLKPGERLCVPFCGSFPSKEYVMANNAEAWACDTDPEAIRIAKDRCMDGKISDFGRGGSDD